MLINNIQTNVINAKAFISGMQLQGYTIRMATSPVFKHSIKITAYKIHEKNIEYFNSKRYDCLVDGILIENLTRNTKNELLKLLRPEDEFINVLK